MASGSWSGRLSAEKLTELKEQVTGILRSCDGQCLELHLFKQVYKNTFGKKFEAHYRQLKSIKLKDVMKSLDSVTVRQQSDIVQIILKDQVEDSWMSPGHATSVSSTDIEEESFSSVNTTHSPPLSPFSPASFQGSGCGDMLVTSPTVTRVPVSEIGQTDPFQKEKSSNEGRSLQPLVGYERLLSEMSTANTGTPVNSSPHLSAEAAVGKTSVHNTSIATGLLSDKELTEIKENATRILESCDGQCLELQRFKKVYRDTFGKRFLTPKKLEKVKSVLNDVIVLEQVGKKINIKLRIQAEKRSASAESSQSVSDNLDESAPAIENEPSLGDTTSVLTPQKPALSPISAAAFKVSNLLPLPAPSTQLNASLGTASVIKRVPPIVIGATAKPISSLLEIMDQQQREISTNEGQDVPPIGYESLLNERSTPRKGTPGHSSPQLNPSRVREVGTPGPFEKSINHAQQITGTITPKTSRTDCSLQEVNKAAEDIITSLSEKGTFVSLEEVKARLCKEFGKSNFRAFGFRKDNAVPALHDLIQLQAKVSLFVHAYVMTNSICTLHELNQSLADLGSKSDFDELKLGPLLQQPVVYDMFKPPSNLPSLPNITSIQILKHLEKYMTQEDLWRKKVDLKLFLDYLCKQYDCDTPYELGVRIQSVGLAISVIKSAKKCESERWKTIREQVLVDMDEEIKRNMRKIKKDLLGQELGDLRSCVMKFLDVSPVDTLNEIFQCSMQLFSIKHQKKISEFLTIITKDSFGRQLFQLALAMSVKRLLGDAFERLVADEVQKQVPKAVVERLDKPPTPPSEGKVVEEVKQWLVKAEQLDLTRLARIEENVVSKFPEFNSFEQLGYGSFLKFLSSHKELQEAIEQVGGFGRSERKGTMLGHPVSLHTVLDFVSQFGTQTSHEIIERSLCTYYGINKVTDLEYGSFSNILKKGESRKKDLPRSTTPLVVYEAPYICQDTGTEEHNSSVLGYMSKEDAIAAIRSTPLLEDVALWTHWDEVYGGDVSKLGELKSFLENEEILINAGKSSTGLFHGSALAVMESSPGVLLRVTTKTSTDIFRDCASRGDPVGAAGHLVSMVMMNGGVANTPVALLSNHVQSALAAMASHDRCCDFVLQCLVRMPRRLAQAVGMKVFYEPLNKLVGSTEAPLLLLSNCRTQIQRSRLHQLGFALGINEWIENFNEQVSGEDIGFSLGELQVQEHKRPIAVVKPVPSSTEQTNQLQLPVAEDSVPALENVNEITVHSEEASSDVDGEEDAVTMNVDASLQEQSPSIALDTENEDECRAVVEQIRREEFGIGLELGEEESKLVQRQREREGRGLHRLSTELYSRDTHFVLELVQNADDNSYPENISDTEYPSLVFVLERHKIVVLNNEVGFMENNIRALCDVGRSTKGAHRYGYIGQKGIGFKSVFRVSDCPEIHSNGFHIRFDAKSGSIGYILPQWIEQGCEEKQTCDDRVENTPDNNLHEDTDAVRPEYARWSTCIVLPLKEQHQGIEKTSLAARFRDVHPSLLLFLHRLRSISIQDKVNNICRDMIRKDLSDNIMEISHSRGTDRWLVMKKQLDASHMKEDVEMTELALAFPLFDEQNLSSGRRHQKLPQQHVFAYLPLRSYGFRFIIQGDFEVPSSREDVDKDKSWNQWLREEIPQLFVDALSIFMEHSSFSRLSCAATYFQFIPLEEEILGFFTPVAKQILTLLQSKPCIPATLASPEAEQPQNVQNNYEWVLPCEAIFCDDPIIQQVVSASKLKKHLELRYLHPGISAALNPTLRSRLGIETLSSKHLIEIGKEEVKTLSLDSDLTISDGGERKTDFGKIAWLAQWLQCMYRSLDQERNSSQDMLDMISSLNVIPLTDGTFVDLNGDCVFLPLSMKLAGEAASKKKKSSSAKSNEQTCFGIVERDLSTVHPALFSSLDDIGRSQVEQLLRRLGVKSWSARDLINSHILPTFKSDKWKTKSKEVLRSYLVYILEQRLSDPSVCNINELRSCVQILTNKGPVNPTNNSIYFTKKFGNTIDLARQLSSISWTLIDESYLDPSTGSKAHNIDWETFLSELGVQHCLAIKRKQVKLHRNNMAQTPWASYEAVWQTTPDGCYVVEDCACEEFEEFLSKIAEPTANRQSICCQSNILAQWIDERWDREYSQYADALVRDSNDHVLVGTRSSFYLNLVLKPWMSASDGQTIYIPRDLFIRNEAVRRLLEDHVKYSAADLRNSRFVETLQIHESITVDGMISEMKKWSTASSGTNKESLTKEFTTSLAHMSEVYSFLYDKMVQNEEQRRKVYDAFIKNALVFVPFRSASTSCIKPQLKLSGSFHALKDVCWRDPTEVAVKLLKDHGKVTTKHLLEGFYHSLSKASAQQSLATFFVDQLKVDETPNVDEYLEMASTVAELAGFPTPLSLNDMLKVFAILGRKCIARGHKDSICIEDEVDENRASFIRNSLDASRKCIFPSSGKWVSLSDKPLLLDNKSQFKIFQKESGVHFIDLADLFQDLKRRSTSQSRKFVNEKEEMKHNVSLFLKACDIQRLSECVKTDFTPTLVKYQCVPPQTYFHQMIPAVQRFLYFKKQTVYEELKNERFAEKLQQMQFASVPGKLETVYSLITHPDVRIVIEEKSLVQPVGSSFCFYVAEEHQENYDVLNGEMVKLLRVKRQDSSDLSNFLVAVKNYSGSDFECFLGEDQGLEPLPDEEERWCVPPPQVLEEVVQEASKDVVPSLNANISLPNRGGDDGLHSWPPKSSAQFNKTLKGEAELRSDNTLKMWPPPAPPDSVKKSLEEKVQIEGRPIQRLLETERPNDRKGTREPDDNTEVMPRRNSKTLILEAANRKENYQTSSPNDPNPVKVDDVTLERVANDALSDEKTESVQDILPLGAQSPPKPERICTLPIPACDARQTSPPRAYISFNEEASEIDYDDLSFNDGDLKVLNGIQLGENPNSEEIGRWGERCVYEFLLYKVKVLPTSENVDIIWLNEEANTTAPYDFEIRRRITGVNQEAESKTVITYIEVKTTSSDQKEFFEISVPELRFALERKEALHLYRVFNAGKPGCLRIRRLKNLASQLERKNVKLFMAI